MSANNVAAVTAAHDEFNRRKFDALLERLAENCTYHDQARGQTFNGRAGFREFLNGWVTAFSNARVSDPTYIDGGDVVIAQFHARGTNDGALGPLPATGRNIDLPMCEIGWFNEQGQIVRGGLYYDQLTMLTQLGLAQAPGAAAGV